LEHEEAVRQAPQVDAQPPGEIGPGRIGEDFPRRLAEMVTPIALPATRARLSACVPGSTQSTASARRARRTNCCRSRSGNSLRTWLTSKVPSGESPSSSALSSREQASWGNAARARPSANDSANGERSCSRKALIWRTPNAATTRRPATPLPQPKSTTGPAGGFHPRPASSASTESHFQPMRSPSVWS
jgi:hypothetical protein